MFLNFCLIFVVFYFYTTSWGFEIFKTSGKTKAIKTDLLNTDQNEPTFSHVRVKRNNDTYRSASTDTSISAGISGGRTLRSSSSGGSSRDLLIFGHNVNPDNLFGAIFISFSIILCIFFCFISIYETNQREANKEASAIHSNVVASSPLDVESNVMHEFVSCNKFECNKYQADEKVLSETQNEGKCHTEEKYEPSGNAVAADDHTGSQLIPVFLPHIYLPADMISPIKKYSDKIKADNLFNTGYM